MPESSSNKVAFKSVRAGSTTKCLAQSVALIKDELKLMYDQIVSVSIHDVKVHHGDIEVVVFYRTESTVDNSEPTDNLEYKVIVRDEDIEWEQIQAEMILSYINAPGQKLCSVGSTFRHVGEEKIAACWTMPGRQQKVFQHIIQSQSDDWETMISNANEWLNTHLTPYEFSGVVMYEDEHPLAERESQEGKRNIIIYHTAGANPKPLSEVTSELESKIYEITTFNVPEAEGWDKVYKQVTDKIADQGQVQGHHIATAITSDMDKKGFCTAVLVKYDLDMAQSLADIRGGGCCTLF